VEATVNLAQVVCAVEFTAESTLTGKVVELRQAAEEAVERQAVA
jgi:hypothetical protein